ncbi:hypothetical protein Ciccas_011727 [Cichlidogyrus casuarinus]|uniref:Uncharacterized protein n=1 Tax=Cichlidogyrus casuarinus TaxID=1844966 RepID=A0ABD2PQV9_9PLAT
MSESKSKRLKMLQDLPKTGLFSFSEYVPDSIRNARRSVFVSTDQNAFRNSVRIKCSHNIITVIHLEDQRKKFRQQIEDGDKDESHEPLSKIPRLDSSVWPES